MAVSIDELLKAATDYQAARSGSGATPLIDAAILKQCVRLMLPGMSEAEYEAYDAEIDEYIKRHLDAIPSPEDKKKAQAAKLEALALEDPAGAALKKAQAELKAQEGLRRKALAAEKAPVIQIDEPALLSASPEEVKLAGAAFAGTATLNLTTKLIDVIAPKAQATGAEMRKVGDVQNGPFAEGLQPLIIVDDRFDPIRASQELSILASIARSMPFSALLHVRH